MISMWEKIVLSYNFFNKNLILSLVNIGTRAALKKLKNRTLPKNDTWS